MHLYDYNPNKYKKAFFTVFFSNSMKILVQQAEIVYLVDGLWHDQMLINDSSMQQRGVELKNTMFLKDGELKNCNIYQLILLNDKQWTLHTISENSN